MVTALIVWLLQAALCAVACVALYLLWRSLESDDPVIGSIVAAGLLARLAAGQALFWISYLGLPLGRRLQLGRGLWFFGVDAEIFFPPAAAAAHEGAGALFRLQSTTPSGFFVQILSLFVYWFGEVTSIAILLNCLSYVAACALLAVMARRQSGSRWVPPAAVAAIATISLLPSMVIWSLQPLKDTLFVLLIVGAFVTCFFLSRALSQRIHPATVAAMFAATWAFVYALSSVRWYFGLVLFLALLFLIGSLVLRAFSGRSLMLALAAMLLLSRAVVLGGNSMPASVQLTLSPWKDLGPKPISLVQEIQLTRERFEDLGGRSIIRAGNSVVGWGTRSDSTVEPRDPEWGAPETLTPPARFVTGAAAMVLPRVVADSLGIVRVQGRDEFWWIVELDTLVFDAMLVLLFVAVVSGWRGVVGDPVAWVIAISTLGIAAGLAYAGTNFGTLFRHRAMVHAGVSALCVVAGTHLTYGAAWLNKWRARMTAVPAPASIESSMLGK